MPFICDRCGFRYEKLRKDWTGLMVCAADYDRKPADQNPPRVGPEGMPRRDARPYPPFLIVEPGDITPDDL